MHWMLADTDTNTMILGVATLVCTMLTTAVGTYISFKMAQLKAQNEAAANKVAEVKTTLEAATISQNEKLNAAVEQVQDVKQVLHQTNAVREEKLNSIAEDTSKTLRLADGAMTEQLEINKKATAELAKATGTAKHKAAADAATHAYDTHVARQKNLKSPKA